MPQSNSSSYILTVTCPAASGVVADISAHLAEHQFYISEMAQFDDEATGTFFCRVRFRAESNAEPRLLDIRQDFTELAERREMQWLIVDAQRPQRVLLMVSKTDHCLQDLFYRMRKGELNMVVPVVVSNHQDLRAQVEREGIRFVHLPVDKSNKAEQEARLLEIVAETKSELVVLARYMQVLSDKACQALTGRCINIHHSFLPGFKGARPYHRAYERGVKLIGATAHYVTADLDEGPIIEQVVEAVDHTQQPNDLVAMGRDLESKALARAVKYHIQRRVFIDNKKSVIFK